MYILSHKGETENLAQTSILPSFQAKGSGMNFKDALAKLFFETDRILHEYADPETTHVNIMGFSPLEKTSPGAQLAIGVAMNNIEAQLNTLLNGLEFMLKTLPQKMDNIFS